MPSSTHRPQLHPASDQTAAVTMQACVLVHEVQRVRSAPRSIDVYDDRSAAALREQILSVCDTRAVLVELACRLDQLQNCHTMSLARQQTLALQVCPPSPPPLPPQTLLPSPPPQQRSNV